MRSRPAARRSRHRCRPWPRPSALTSITCSRVGWSPRGRAVPGQAVGDHRPRAGERDVRDVGEVERHAHPALGQDASAVQRQLGEVSPTGSSTHIHPARRAPRDRRKGNLRHRERRHLGVSGRCAIRQYITIALPGSAPPPSRARASVPSTCEPPAPTGQRPRAHLAGTSRHETRSERRRRAPHSPPMHESSAVPLPTPRRSGCPGWWSCRRPGLDEPIVAGWTPGSTISVARARWDCLAPDQPRWWISPSIQRDILLWQTPRGLLRARSTAVPPSSKEVGLNGLVSPRHSKGSDSTASMGGQSLGQVGTLVGDEQDHLCGQSLRSELRP